MALYEKRAIPFVPKPSVFLVLPTIQTERPDPAFLHGLGTGKIYVKKAIGHYYIPLYEKQS
jgi:hypothetical protein